jgi:hypothetical protein
MAYTLKDSYNTNDDAGNYITNAHWEGQRFTAGSSYTVTRVGFKLYRTAGVTGTLTVHVRATAATGEDLASGTYDVSTITTDTGGEWIYFSLGAGTALTGSTAYTVILSFDVADINKVYLRWDASSPAYGGGSRIYSNNSGSSWTTDGTRDDMFETYSGSEGGGSVLVPIGAKRLLMGT